MRRTVNKSVNFGKTNMSFGPKSVMSIAGNSILSSSISQSRSPPLKAFNSIITSTLNKKVPMRKFYKDLAEPKSNTEELRLSNVRLKNIPKIE